MVRALAWTFSILFLLAAGCGAHWRSLPGSCRAAVIQAGVDGYNGKGTTQQGLMLQQRCETDRAIAAANEVAAAQAAQMVQLQEIERQRLEFDRQRQQQELALAKAQADEARARADAAQANADAIRSGQAASVGAVPVVATPVSSKILLFGGSDHKTFLGCVCDKTDSDSVLNKYGEYGNRYSLGPSIWNRYGDFGSKYADTSICNKYANDPPILVTDGGDAVGYLTLNRYKAGAITDPTVLEWLDKAVCENE